VDWEYDAGFTQLVGEYSDPLDLNAIASRLWDLSDYDLERVVYLANNGHKIGDALDNYEDVTLYVGMNLRAVAEQLVDDGLFGTIPDSIANYIDYDAIARDLRHDGYDETPTGVFEYRR
jgi:antirestriction protein